MNVKKEKSLHVLRYAVHGAYEDEKFDLMVLRSYINEMFEYQALINYAIGDALTSLLFWRSQWNFCGFSVPLHSFVAFVIGVHLVENPRMLPSFFFFSIAWMMIASMGCRYHHPSSWLRCKSFFTYLEILIRGRSSSVNMNVAPGEGAAAAARLEAAWKDRRETDAEKSEKRYALQLELNNIGKDDIQAGTKVKLVDPLAAYLPILLRVQKRLRGICDSMRNLNSILKGEESILSFWVTFVCLVAGTVLLVLPWAFILQWVCRIAVWAFLGPWMKLVDIYVVKNDSLHLLNEEERKKIKETHIRELVTHFKTQSKIARLRGEDTLKMKAIRAVRFGPYSTRIPDRNITRHFDYPLPDSMAVHEEELDASIWQSIKRGKVLPGQKLDGVMIPCHSADHDHDSSAVSPGVQKKLSALQTAALHLAAESRQPTEGRHRLISPIQQRVEFVSPLMSSPRVYSKTEGSKELPSIKEAVARPQETDVALASREEESTPSSASRRCQKDSIHEKRQEVEEQGLEVVAELDCELPPEDDGDTEEEATRTTDEITEALHLISLSPSYRSSDYVEIMFLR